MGNNTSEPLITNEESNKLQYAKVLKEKYDCEKYTG